MPHAKLLRGSFLGWLIAVMIFLFFAFFRPKVFGPAQARAQLTIDLKNRVLTVSTDELAAPGNQLSSYDPRTHFIDSQEGLAFDLPTKSTWGAPQVLMGLEEITSALLKNVSSEILKHLFENFKDIMTLNPLGPMLTSAKLVRFDSRAAVDVAVTNDTSTDLMSVTLEKVIAEDKKAGHSRTPAELTLLRNNLRNSLIGLEKLHLTNWFQVMILDKRLIPPTIKMSLPSAFIVAASVFGLQFDKLVANEHTILATASAFVRNAKIAGKLTDLEVDHALMAIQNNNFFFFVEINYSPQVGTGVQTWDELNRLMNSVRVTDS